MITIKMPISSSLGALLIGLSLSGAPAFAQPKNLVTLQPAPVSLTAQAPAPLHLVLTVPPGYIVYRDMLSVTVLDADGLTLGTPSLPAGILKPDPASPGQDREQYDMDVVIEIPVQNPAPGSYAPTLEVEFQSCRDSLCFLPKKESVSLPVTISGAAAAPADAAAAGGGGAPVLARPSVDFSALPESAAVRKQDIDKPHPVLARLLSDQSTVAPGGTVRLGVHLQQDEGWHTYWHTPGEVGKPPIIEWSLPAGAAAAPPVFPLPHRFDDGVSVSYGYDGENMLFSAVTLPADLPAGPLTIQADVRWLVCEKQCIPGSVSLSLPLTVAAQPVPSPYSPLFDYFAAQHPAPLDAVRRVLDVDLSLSADKVGPSSPFQATLRVRPREGTGPLSIQQDAGTWPAFAPIADGNFMITGVKVQQEAASAGGALVITLDAETFELFEGDPLPEADRIGGLVQLQAGNDAYAFEIAQVLPWVATPTGVPVGEGVATIGNPPEGGTEAVDPAAAAAAAVTPAQSTVGLLSALVMAFVGGSILNIMPCVLPVLTLKLYSLIGQQHISDAERRNAGLAYTGGILASFLALAVAVLVLKALTGNSVGWGFQFQYPGYVASLATIVFAFGLNLFGVFELPTPGANQMAEASNKEGLLGYFMTGVVATLLATPCSAPFLGTGMGFAFSLPPAGIIAFFLVAGLGLAMPFLVIAFVPVLMRFLPQPGPWMDAFKQLLGFTLIATTVWLVDVLAAQVGRDGVTGFLAFLTVVGLGAWIYGQFGSAIHSMQRQLGVLAGVVVLILGSGWYFVDLRFAEEPTCETDVAALTSAASLDYSEEIPWVPFSEKAVRDLQGKLVFIDFTADWCVSCKVNERTVLETATVRQSMAAAGVVPLKADWTRQDDVITAWLQRFGKAGVPFYLILPADPTKAPIALPEILTPAIVQNALQEATAG